jgi:hypothetical protein
MQLREVALALQRERLRRCPMLFCERAAVDICSHHQVLARGTAVPKLLQRNVEAATNDLCRLGAVHYQDIGSRGDEKQGIERESVLTNATEDHRERRQRCTARALAALKCLPSNV